VAWTLRVILDTSLLFMAVFRVYKISFNVLLINGVGHAGITFIILVVLCYIMKSLTGFFQLPIQILLIISVLGSLAGLVGDM